MNAVPNKASRPRGARGRSPAKKPSGARKPASTMAKAAATAKGPLARIAHAVATNGAANAAINAPRTLTELMAQALVMETDAAHRYGEFADAMEVHNNLEVAALFRKMAGIERKHAAQIRAEMGWEATLILLPGKPCWEGFEPPETAPGDEVHYLMQPYHVLQLALLNEQRAERFFARLVRLATQESVRKAARRLQAEEREHVALVKAWMKKYSRPDRNWANDPDPATSTD